MSAGLRATFPAKATITRLVASSTVLSSITGHCDHRRIFVAGVAQFEPYPLIEMTGGARPWLLGAAIALIALLPLTSRRGVEL